MHSSLLSDSCPEDQLTKFIVVSQHLVDRMADMLQVCLNFLNHFDFSWCILVREVISYVVYTNGHELLVFAVDVIFAIYTYTFWYL